MTGAEEPDTDREDDSDGTPPSDFEPDADVERWEDAGREALDALLERHRNDLLLEIEDTIAAIEGGFPVTSDHVSRLRRSVADLEITVEESLAHLPEGTRPWESSARRIPNCRLVEELGLDPSVVDEGESVEDETGRTY